MARRLDQPHRPGHRRRAGRRRRIAAFVAYQQSRTFSKTPELYGTGHLEGLIAPESANNGVTSGTLIPLLVIGIPGGATAAIMLVVLQYHGVTLGPRLFHPARSSPTACSWRWPSPT